jgi:hypothetical protein
VRQFGYSTVLAANRKSTFAKNIAMKNGGLMNIQPAHSRSFIFRVSLFTLITAVSFVLAQDPAKQEDPLPPGSKQLIQPDELAQCPGRKEWRSCAPAQRHWPRTPQW